MWLNRDNILSNDDKCEYLTKASLIWDNLTEREKGRLEGKLEALEKYTLDKKETA